MAEELLKGVSDGIAELFNDGKKNEERNGVDYSHPYAKVEKSKVLLSTRDFHDSKKVQDNPKEIASIMTKLLLLQNSRDSREKLLRVEATEVFFASTKLFISSDSSVKRLIYLFIKEVCHHVDPSDVIIVTSCLTKDMTCDVDLYRANALRTLVHIIDSAMLGALERYIKQAIIDKSSIVSSSALVSSMHFFRASKDSASIVRRWVREITEALNSPCDMVQFHATQLLYQIKANDRLAVFKFVQTYAPGNNNHNHNHNERFTSSSSPLKPSHNGHTKHKHKHNSPNKRTTIRSPLGLLCLIRYTTKLLHDEITQGRANTTRSLQTASQLCTIGYHLLESSLRHESEMVTFEAARALCTLPNLHAEDVQPALSVLQVLLSSPKPAARMGAVKTLNTLSSTHPRLVAKFNEDLEALLGDSNRLIGTIAIMTLLKTGNRNSIDRLLKSMATFLSYIADEYKVMIVRSLEVVCILFPEKHVTVVEFMSKFLREEGGFRFKTTIVESMISLMNKVEESREASLMYLCEFIEDCEFVRLSTQILHLVGDLGPKTNCPARFVRFIYNRVILERAMIRAAAISVLGKFGAACPSLRGSIMVLLRRCVEDEDDEARDRAILALTVLELAEKESPYIEPSEEEREEMQRNNLLEGEKEDSCAEDSGAFLLLTRLPISFDNLQRRLELYQANPGAMESAEPLSLTILPIVEDTEIIITQSSIAATEQLGYESVIPTSSSPISPQKKLEPSSILFAIPEFAAFGRVFQSSKAVPLTENEAEYVVHCIKHIYKDNVVLQFIVENTIEDQILTNVSVTADSQTQIFEPIGEIPADTIAYGTTASCFTVLRRDKDTTISSTAIVCELKFMVTQFNLDTGEEEGDSIEEEYTLENVEINVSDFITQTSVRDFKRSWAASAGEGEVLQKFSLRQNKLDDAIATLIECLGLQVCDGTGRVRPGAKQHMIHLSGTFLEGVTVLARAQVSMGSSNTTVLKIAVRSKSATVSKMVAESIS